jgi:hypothetical protein
MLDARLERSRIATGATPELARLTSETSSLIAHVGSDPVHQRRHGLRLGRPILLCWLGAGNAIAGRCTRGDRTCAQKFKSRGPTRRVHAAQHVGRCRGEETASAKRELRPIGADILARIAAQHAPGAG